MDKVLIENAEARDGCVVNENLPVYLQLQGAENTDASRKNKGEHQNYRHDNPHRLQHAEWEVEAQPDMSELRHASPLMPDQRSQIEERFACELEAKPDMSEPGHAPPLMSDQRSQIEERFACELEAKPDMSEPGHAPPLMPDKGSQIEERFLSFLKGYEVNGDQLYKIIHKALATINCGDMNINYKHLQQFDPILANTIHFFCGSVQTNLAKAAKVFLKEEVGFQCENPLVKICDRPLPCSFMLLKEFWSLPEHHPSEECGIYWGETFLHITKTTRDGRIILLNLLRKIFCSFEKGYSWNGVWTIADVMVCPETYQVEIIKPFCKKCNDTTLRQDILVVSTGIIPEFKCGGRFPAFFGHLDSSLRKFVTESHLSAVTWKKFRDFVTAHFALRPPLTRSRFLDNLHEMHHGPKKLLQIILSDWSSGTDWRLFLKDFNPVVYEQNWKLGKISQERKAIGADNRNKNAKKDNTTLTNDQVEVEQAFDAEVVQALAAGVVQANDAEVEDHLNTGVVQTRAAEIMQDLVTEVEQAKVFGETKDQESEPFEGTLLGLLSLSRHIKQHGFKGSKDNKEEQKIQELSEVDLVLSHIFEMLPEILKALIYKIDSEELKYNNADDYDTFLVMFREIFEAYNTPEFVPYSYQ